MGKKEARLPAKDLGWGKWSSWEGACVPPAEAPGTTEAVLRSGPPGHVPWVGDGEKGRQGVS